MAILKLDDMDLGIGAGELDPLEVFKLISAEDPLLLGNSVINSHQILTDNVP